MSDGLMYSRIASNPTGHAHHVNWIEVWDPAALMSGDRRLLAVGLRKRAGLIRGPQ